jgi:uncharacterized protein (DUF2141 family)
MTNAPSGQPYTLRFTLDGTDDATDITCTSAAQNSCSASVSGLAMGTYDVRLIVLANGDDLLLNTLDNGFTVTGAPAACVHSECLPGPRLGSTCSACATAVCTAMATCCTTEWTAACATAADAETACAAICNAPTVNGFSPDEVEEDEETAVTVQTSALPTTGYSYTLSLTGPQAATFPCSSPSGDSCTATVSGLADGIYAASLVIQALSGTMPTFQTASLASALVVTPAAAPVTCFSGGTGLDPDGNGTCATPWVVDLIGSSVGTVLFHAAGQGGNTRSFGSGDLSCGWTTRQRTEIYRVNLPDIVSGFEVSVDAAGSANPRIAVMEDSSCTQPTTICGDSGAADACEVVRAESGTGTYFGNSPYVAITSDDDGQAITVRFRAY